MTIVSLSILPALGYIGPGGALTFFGSIVALVAAVLLAFFGFVWYPLKRLLRWRRSSRLPPMAGQPVALPGEPHR